MDFTEPEHIEHWLGQLSQLESTHTAKIPSFLKPFHISTLALTMRRNNAAYLNLPEETESFAITMNLYQAAGVYAPREGNRSRNGYIPVELIREESNVDYFADELVRILKDAIPNSFIAKDVHTMFLEIIGNCFHHSGEVGGIYGSVCAQVWPNGQKMQVVINDIGMGIRKSLGQNAHLSEELRSKNCCALATEYGISGKLGHGHSGYGLFIARELIQQNNGMLALISGDELFYFSSNTQTQKKISAPWSGTLLVLELNTDRPVDISKIYKDMPLPEGFSHDDFLN